ncbi:MAG: L,D-transpeptidase family protein [Pseudomarimonas sp.]
MTSPTSSSGHRRAVLIGLMLVLAVAGLMHERLEIAAAYAANHLRTPRTVEDRLREFGAPARERLLPHFASSGVTYPGERVTLVAFKDQRVLLLYAQDASGLWHYIQKYSVRAASGTLGPKLREGDGQVPEGIYRVTFLNANSLYHVSLRLDYPNAFDREMARADGRTQLGGDIMIHGKSVSIGCLAMGDAVAEELFTLAADIGMQKMQVIIAPTDFRQSSNATLPSSPSWLTSLYRELRETLAGLPLPSPAA